MESPPMWAGPVNKNGGYPHLYRVYRCKEGVLYDVTNEYNHIDLTEDGEDN